MASTLYEMSKQHGPEGVGRAAEGSRPVGIVCPYCGLAQAATEANQCSACRGLFDPLSRQATQNAMGPWWVLSPNHSTAPGISYEKLAELVRRGKVTRSSVVRGPTTRQFWALARDVAGVAVLLGECHNCHAESDPDEFICAKCNTVLAPRSDRQHLGLAPVQLLPGEASPAEIAASTRRTGGATPGSARAAAPAPAMRHAAPVTLSDDQAAVDATGASGVRRLRRQMAHLQTMLVILLIVVGVLVAAVALLILDPFEGVSFGAPKEAETAGPVTGAGESASSDGGEVAPSLVGADSEPVPAATEAPAIVPPSVGEQLPDAALLDAALGPWKRQYLEALRLQELDTIESVEEAIGVLESILAEARGVEGLGDDASFPLVEGRLESLRDRLEVLRLQEILGSSRP